MALEHECTEELVQRGPKLFFFHGRASATVGPENQPVTICLYNPGGLSTRSPPSEYASVPVPVWGSPRSLIWPAEPTVGPGLHLIYQSFQEHFHNHHLETLTRYIRLKGLYTL